MMRMRIIIIIMLIIIIMYPKIGKFESYCKIDKLESYWWVVRYRQHEGTAGSG